MKSERKNSKVYEPTAREIRRACEKIQEGWSQRERRKRAGRLYDCHWTPPLVTNEWLTVDSSYLADEAMG